MTKPHRPSEKDFVIHWFRRDLRLNDNASLLKALQSGYRVRGIFIFDPAILNPLPDTDARVPFILSRLSEIRKSLRRYGSDLWIYFREPVSVFKEYSIDAGFRGVFASRDYEPFAVQRDRIITDLLTDCNRFSDLTDDQVIFPPGSVLKNDSNPYTVFTAYKKKWLQNLTAAGPGTTFRHLDSEELLRDGAEKTSGITEIPERFFKNFGTGSSDLPELSPALPVPSFPEISSVIKTYHLTRDYPAIENGTTRMGVHLRFGTVSIRSLAAAAWELNETFLSELIWREFFMQILFYFPESAEISFREKFRKIQWNNDPDLTEAWMQGRTGYALVDAGMRELNQTGFMHNRVRMLTASFLVKHLLTDWKIGERYFAEKLMDFDLAANTGNWQWAAGTGCDAAPYFRIFSPERQQKRFDPDLKYIQKWAPEYVKNGKITQPFLPVVNHEKAREKTLAAYKWHL